MELSKETNVKEKLHYDKRCINDDWLFAKENDRFSKIDIPHTWNAEDGNTGGSNYHRGLCFYKKNIFIEENLKGTRIYIEFEGANSETHVFLNKKKVGRHLGGYSTFRFEITNLLAYGRENNLEVHVDNSHQEEVYPLMADFTFFGGIYRNVHLIIVRDVHFDLMDYGSAGVYLSQKSISRDEAVIGFEAKVANQSDTKKEVKCVVDVLDHDNKQVKHHEETAIITQNSTFFKDIIISNPHLWQGIEDPYLYTFETKLYVDDILVDNRTQKIGLRYYEVDPQKGFILNGIPTKLNGVSRHQDRAEKGWALTKSDQLDDMEIIKEIGANSIRLAHYQHNQYFYNLCDKYGMIVWAEIPFISMHSKTDPTGENAMSQMIELVRQNYNHCSICFWGVQNEITIGGKKNRIEDIVTRLHKLTKREDPYRLTTQAQVGHHPDDDSMNAVTDVLAYNRYHGWYYDEIDDFDTWLTNFAKQNPSICLGISEYGAEGILAYHTDEPKAKDYTEEYHALYHEKALQIFNKHPELWGTYVWNMFDFASDLRDEGGVQGMNNKGLVTHDRKIRKDAFFYYKASWSKEPVLHITSKRYVERLTDTISIKVYTNRNQVLLKANGQEIDSQPAVNHVVVFDKVPLIDGDNSIVVVSGDLQDEATFQKVNELKVSYEAPEKSQGGMVANWFDEIEDLDTNIHPINYIDGHYSLNDTIEDILKSEEGEALLRKYMAPFFEHPMFDMAKSFSLKMLADFDKKNFNAVLIYNIAKELNTIKKV